MNKAKLLGLVLILAIVLPLSGAFAQDEMVELPEIDPAFVEGDIVTAGSSTVGPLTQAMVERFEDAGYEGTITVDIIGSGAGFERFCVNAETDISNASRPIKEEEVVACGENGREPIEFRVGTDALAVTVSQENDFVEELTMEQLAEVFAGGQGITWADINAEWPAEPILLYSPGTDSGTFDFFTEVVFDEETEPILNAEGIQLSEDDNVLVNGVADSPYAIGYFGYAYYLENRDTIRPLSINGVEPSDESVEATGDDAYPLARPLFIYSDATIMQEKPQVAQFVAYYLSNTNEIIEEVGYFAASETALNSAMSAWCDAMADTEWACGE